MRKPSALKERQSAPQCELSWQYSELCSTVKLASRGQITVRLLVSRLPDM